MEASTVGREVCGRLPFVLSPRTDVSSRGGAPLGPFQGWDGDRGLYATIDEMWIQRRRGFLVLTLIILVCLTFFRPWLLNAATSRGRVRPDLGWLQAAASPSSMRVGCSGDVPSSFGSHRGHFRSDLLRRIDVGMGRAGFSRPWVDALRLALLGRFFPPR